jgi:ubiquinone/menaquinone biosynthesis C-methylase UbiE
MPFTKDLQTLFKPRANFARRRWIANTLTAMAIFWSCGFAAAWEPDADAKIPPPLTEYQGRTIAQTMHYLGADWLTRESRQREEDCTTMLKALGLKPGQTVCDMGCGNGFYTLKLAEVVGKTGTVYAVDIQQEMLRLLEARTEKTELKNIKPILGNVIDPRLPEKSLDLILCADVYHEFSHPAHMLAAMRKSLKKDGRLVLVEFRQEDPNVPIKELHKMSKAQILKELEPNGFKLVEQFDKLPWQHMMFFVRAE